MNNRELDIPCSWREIEDEDVEFTPFHIAQKLLSVTSDHRAAKNCGGVFVEEEAHTHEFDSMTFDGENFLVLVCVRAFVGSEHEGDTGAVDIAIAESDFFP